MVEEHRLKQIGDSKFLLVPHEYIKVFNLNEYVYLCEVLNDGKTITYKRMRKKDVSKEI